MDGAGNVGEEEDRENGKVPRERRIAALAIVNSSRIENDQEKKKEQRPTVVDTHIS